MVFYDLVWKSHIISTISYWLYKLTPLMWEENTQGYEDQEAGIFGDYLGGWLPK